MHVCLLPPGYMLQVGVVLVGKPQWSTSHGVTSLVAVCVCVCVCVCSEEREGDMEEGWLIG